jgi:hypothetical protein
VIILSAEKTVTTTPQRQLTAAEAIAEFRKARKAGDDGRAQERKEYHSFLARFEQAQERKE